MTMTKDDALRTLGLPVSPRIRMLADAVTVPPGRFVARRGTPQHHVLLAAVGTFEFAGPFGTNLLDAPFVLDEWATGSGGLWLRDVRSTTAATILVVDRRNRSVLVEDAGCVKRLVIETDRAIRQAELGEPLPDDPRTTDEAVPDERTVRP